MYSTSSGFKIISKNSTLITLEDDFRKIIRVEKNIFDKIYEKYVY